MLSNEKSPSEDFIRMIQVLADDEDLRKWFISMRFMAENLRYSLIGTMVEEMKANQEDPDLIAAIRSLMDPAVFDAALKTVLKLQE